MQLLGLCFIATRNEMRVEQDAPRCGLRATGYRLWAPPKNTIHTPRWRLQFSAQNQISSFFDLTYGYFKELQCGVTPITTRLQDCYNMYCIVVKKAWAKFLYVIDSGYDIYLELKCLIRYSQLWHYHISADLTRDLNTFCNRSFFSK